MHNVPTYCLMSSVFTKIHESHPTAGVARDKFKLCIWLELRFAITVFRSSSSGINPLLHINRPP